MAEFNTLFDARLPDARPTDARFPNPAKVKDRREGVRPEEMTSDVVDPVPEEDVGTVNSTRAQNTTNAINAAFATGYKVILGDSTKGPKGTYVVEGTIAPSGNNADPEFGQRRQVQFDAIGLRCRAGSTDASYREILGLDRTKGTGIVLTSISNATPAVITKANHGQFVGQAGSFATTGALPTGLLVRNSVSEAANIPGTYDDGTTSADDSTVYYVSAAGFGQNAFQVAKTRADALAGVNSVATSSAGSGTHTWHYGSLVGRVAIDNFPVPTSPVRLLFDLGNTRYSHFIGNLRLHGGGKANMALMGTSGYLTKEVHAGSGQSVFNGSVNFASAGYGVYISHKLDSQENLFLADTLTGAVIDNFTFEESVDKPMVVAGNSMDGAAIARLRIAAGDGTRSYITNTHFNVKSAFLHCDDGSTYIFDYQKASIHITECYCEGATEGQNNFAAPFLQRGSSNLVIGLLKASSGPSAMAIGLVDFVGTDGSVKIGLQENSEESDIVNLIRLTRTGSGNARLCEVFMPFKEVSQQGPINPFIMTNTGATADQLLLHSTTSALSKWEPSSGSTTPTKKVPTWV